MKRSIIALLALLLLIPALTFGQAETTGRVSGRVADEEANPIAGARVTLVSPALQGERSARRSAVTRPAPSACPARPR